MIRVLRELHEAPKEYQEILRRYCGLNPYGENLVRLAWGCNRLSWKCGKWEDRDSEGYLIREQFEARLVPKYPEREKWHIEMWNPPHKYGTPESWWAEQKLENPSCAGDYLLGNGPYPQRGEYESIFIIETIDKHFRQLDSRILHFLGKHIRTFLIASAMARRQAIKDQQEQEALERDKRMDDILTPNEPFNLASTNTSSAGKSWKQIIREDRLQKAS